MATCVVTQEKKDFQNLSQLSYTIATTHPIALSCLAAPRLNCLSSSTRKVSISDLAELVLRTLIRYLLLATYKSRKSIFSVVINSPYTCVLIARRDSSLITRGPLAQTRLVSNHEKYSGCVPCIARNGISSMDFILGIPGDYNMSECLPNCLFIWSSEEG